MALRWTVTAPLEAEKGFRRIKAYRQMPFLAARLVEHAQRVKKEMGFSQEERVA